MSSITNRILVSLLVRDEDQLLDQLDTLHGKVGWVELRLDLLPTSLDLTALMVGFPQLQFIAAILLESEGGFFAGSHEQRCERLQKVAACGFAYVDFPLDSVAVALPVGVKRIVSWHQPHGQVAEPSSAFLIDLQQRAEQQAGAGGLVKLVAWADFAEQALEAVALQQGDSQKGDKRGNQLIAFAQGPGSSAARVMSLLAGAPWIYCCWPGEQTAPGQWDYQSLVDLLPKQANTQTQIYGVIGNPVDHSMSPLLWNAALRKNGNNAVYLRFPVAEPHSFLRLAGGCGVQALSVTAPWKQVAAEISENTVAGGAANFLVRRKGNWHGYNTDGAGALDSLLAAGFHPGGKLLLLGAGGAARGVVTEAIQRGYRVTVAARRLEQAVELQTDCEAASQLQTQPANKQASTAKLQICALADAQLQDFDAIIQATSLGSLSNPASPTPGRTARAGAIALDMVYQPLQTQWLASAEAAGAISLQGTEMLIRQMLAQLSLAAAIDSDFATLNQIVQLELEQRSSVILIGARACGKSSLGRALAQRLRWQFLDADEELEKRHQRSISDWIAADYEGFRDAEAKLLPELLTKPRHVVALGGGVVEREESVQLLDLAPRVVFLDCPVETLLKRQQMEPRPALSDLPLAEEIQQLLDRRMASYTKCAALKLKNSGQIAETVERLATNSVLKLFPIGTR
jgi:shikimate dehydrogenase/3-dehydroquinate dehydratase type I